MFLVSTLLSHPLTRGLSIDDPESTALRRQIISDKPFLRKIYLEWYKGIAANIAPGPGPVLEIGSGGGFLEEFIPGLITSEIFPCPNAKIVLDGQCIPFADASLRAMVMTNVLHHIPKSRQLFSEAARCVKPGGTFVAIEPWVTGWSRLVYNRFHYEPFDEESGSWDIPSSGPLSGANGALPWMIFHRDRAIFEREFPEWEIRSIQPCMPLRYLLSGGVTLRGLMPGFTFGFWRAMETMMDPWRDRLAMFAQITLFRRE